MITFQKGDILRCEAQALVNTVNCVGVMGRGVALQFRKAFPDNFKAYEAACRNGEVTPGRMFTFETGLIGGPEYIVNFPTKRHWKGKSQMEDIDSGLLALVEETRNHKITSIAVPPLGCGLGGLDWQNVRPRIVDAFQPLHDVRVFIYEPGGEPAADAMVRLSTVPGMTSGRAVLIELMSRYLTAVMDPFITLLEIHKLMYFMQEAGEKLRLNYEKAHYGPYAKNLRHVLSAVDGHFIAGYGDAEDNPERPIELLPGVTGVAAALIESNPDTHTRFQRVAKLIRGFETPFGMELLATVHWVCAKEGARSGQEAISRTYAWSERKRGFTTDQILLARDVLESQSWL